MFYRPTKKNVINSPYGMRVHPIRKIPQMHQGQDYVPITRGISGDDIICFYDGVVKLARWQYNHRGFGRYIIVEHNINGKAVCTLYCHLKGFNVKAGQRVKGGQVLGFMGTSGASTGVHCHFGIFECDYKSFSTKGPHGFKYPVDPEKYFKLNNTNDIVSNWAKKAWNWGIDTGVTKGERPKDKITREEVVQMLYNVEHI